jgi:ubiquinone/menaquinone biosynthesis C-methylase UbiE
MPPSMIENLFKGVYVSLRLFQSGRDYDLVAVVLAPDLMDGDARGLSIRCNTTGRVAGKVVDSASKYWAALAAYMPPGFYIVQAKASDFTAFAIDPDGLFRPPADLRFEVVDGFGAALGPGLESTWYAMCSLPLPSPENILRVAGRIGVHAFLLGGATWHARLERLIRQYAGRDSATLDAILDWGVGCGRIARHFLERGHRNIHGADIDALNIDWLVQTTGWDRAVRIDFDPPMPYPDAFFDVVYGHSVFTHLAYEDQFKWLAEIRRVLKPGGHAFVTVCSEPGVYITKFRDMELKPDFLTTLLERGFYDLAAQNVGVDTGREGYYRLVAHTRRFIRERWSEHLDICRIMPCFMDHQDLVILRRPG